MYEQFGEKYDQNTFVGTKKTLMLYQLFVKILLNQPEKQTLKVWWRLILMSNWYHKMNSLVMKV